jgi:CBS domain-containing protein
MSLASEVRNGHIGHLDLEAYVKADESTSVREVVRLMRRLDRTTTLVTRDDRLAGIFTERDVLRKVVTRPETWDRPVRELMTPDPVVAHPDATILGALRLMNEGHFRDLPVVNERGKILGNLTDNAIVRYLADHLPAEVLNLPPDPNQVPKTVEGA